MARQTRAQRRARRQQQDQSRQALESRQPQPEAAVPPAQRARPRPQVRAPADAAPREGGGGVRIPGFRFIGESWGELKKVDWPGQSQLIQATTVVLLACAIVGVYLWGADLVLKRLVQKVFLGE